VIPHPVAVFSCTSWLLARQSSDHFVRTLLIETETDQDTSSIVDSPVTPIPCDRNGVVSLQGDGAACICYSWLTLLAATPTAIRGLVRVPDLAVALIPLEHSFVCLTVRALVVCGLRRALAWRRWWLCWSLDAEPFTRLLDLRFDAGEVHPAQGHQDFMTIEGGLQGVG
jgi:hypothetical protein